MSNEANRENQMIREIPIWMTAGSKCKVNGKTFTVESRTASMCHLVGPRGGEASLIENIHGDVLRIIRGWGRQNATDAVLNLEAI